MDMLETEPANPAELQKICFGILRDRLPEGWELQESRAASQDRDDVLLLRGPDGTTAKMVAETKMNMERRDVAQTLDQLAALTRLSGTNGLVISRYLSASVREALARRSASYIDATGNIRIQITVPLVYISDRGQDSDPWRSRKGRPRGTLKGSPASRVIRSLIDVDRDWSVRELVEDSGVSTGSTYRVLEYLQDEGLIEKNELARYAVKAWRPLMEAWSKDYSFLKSNRTVSFIDPRGISNFTNVAPPTNTFKWAITGSMAASEWAPYAETKAVFIYVENISSAAAAWNLRPATSGANFILAEPESNIAFKGARVSSRTGLRIAAPSQVAIDLLTGPGRNPSEGVELMNWMEQNEPIWRR